MHALGGGKESEEGLQKKDRKLLASWQAVITSSRKNY